MINKRMINKKKGLSPVIATVLLVGIVIVMALIVFMWIKSINEEAITKFDGQNVKIVCENVEFDASYNSGFLQVANRGNVPIFQMKAKLSDGGEHTTINLDSGWPEVGLLVGDASKIGPLEADGYRELLLIPVLAGESSEGPKTYTCDERFGQVVTII